MENNLLKNDKEISNNQNNIVNTNTTPENVGPEIIGMQQPLNVRFFVKISKHAKDRYEERELSGLATWGELLMNSDFGVQVFNAILTKRVTLMKGITEKGMGIKNSDNRYEDNSFIYYNAQHNISLPLFWTNYMVSEKGTIIIEIFVKTVFWKNGIYRYKKTEKGQQVLSSDKDTFGYNATVTDNNVFEFSTLIPINFKVRNSMAPKYNDEADRCIRRLKWRDTPTRVAAGCIRKSLSYIIDMWLSDKLEGMFTLTENSPKPPLNVGIICNGFNYKEKTFYFAFRRMSFYELSYGENKNIAVTRNNDNSVKNILSKGSKVQDGLKRYSYITETHLKQIIKESLLKYLSSIL